MRGLSKGNTLTKVETISLSSIIFYVRLLFSVWCVQYTTFNFHGGMPTRIGHNIRDNQQVYENWTAYMEESVP